MKIGKNDVLSSYYKSNNDFLDTYVDKDNNKKQKSSFIMNTKRLW